MPTVQCLDMQSFHEQLFVGCGGHMVQLGQLKLGLQGGERVGGVSKSVSVMLKEREKKEHMFW